MGRIAHKNPKIIWENPRSGVNGNDSLESDIAEGIDALNYCLVELGCEPQLRAFIDAVFGASSDYADREEFELCDADLAARAVPARYGEESETDAKKRLENGKKWTQFWRKKLMKWQQDVGFTLITCKEGYGYSVLGGYDGRPSRYCNLIRSLPAEVLRIARSSPLWESRPGEAKRLAAKQAVAQYPRKLTEPRPQRVLRPQKELEKNLNTIRTKLIRGIELMNDPEVKMTDDIRELAYDVRHLMGKLDALLLTNSISSDSSPLLPNHGENENLQILEEDVLSISSITSTSSTVTNEEELEEGGEDKILPVQNVTGTQVVDDQFIDRLQETAFSHLDVRSVYNKFQIHCELKGHQPSKEYFFNFLKLERVDAKRSLIESNKRYLTQLRVGGGQPISFSTAVENEPFEFESRLKQALIANIAPDHELQTARLQPGPDVIELVEYAGIKANIEASEDSLRGAQWLLTDWSLDECKKGVDELCNSGICGLGPLHFWRKVNQVNGTREMSLRLSDKVPTNG